MLLSRHQNAGESHNVKVANGFFENVAKCRYLETTVTNEYLIYEERKTD
jgi:hypothetical protein